MLMSSIQKGASDIHIEPYEKEFRIRFRIDGILYNVMAPPMKFRDAITSRVKIMAKLDIAEKRLPQDGRIKIRFAAENGTKEIDFRVSCLPTLFGEKIVLAFARQRQVDARHDEARVRAGLAEEAGSRDRQAVGHGAGDRPDRQRQDQHALFVDREDQHAGNQHHDGGGSGRIQPGRRQPGPGPREHRAELRRGAAFVPAAGPQHHPRRRNPRLRNRGNRRQGGAHRPPRALDAAHQRRAEHDQPVDEHGHRAVPRRQLGQPDLRAAARAPHLRELQDRGAARAAGAGGGGIHARKRRRR